MGRRSFTREFKVEAVRLVRERGVTIAQAARDLDVHENVIRKWVKDFETDPGQAFPGHGTMKPVEAVNDPPAPSTPRRPRPREGPSSTIPDVTEFDIPAIVP